MIYILLIASLLINFLFMMLTTLLPILVNNITHSYAEVGYVLMVFMVSLLLIRIFCLIKKIKPLIAIIFGTFLFALGFLLLYFIRESLLFYFIGASFFGIAIGLVPPAILTLLTKGEKSESTIRMYNIIVAFASACAPFTAEKMYHFSLDYLYLVWVIGSILLFASSFLLIRHSSTKNSHSGQLKTSTSVKSDIFQLKKQSQVFIILFLSSISYGAFITYLSIYLNSINYSIGAYYFMFWTAYVLAQYIRKFIDVRKWENLIISVALIICVLSDMTLSFSRCAWFLYGAGFFYGLMYGLLFNIFYMNASNISDEKSRNNVYAIIGLMSYIGVGVAPIFLRPFLKYGLAHIFAYSSFYLLVALAIKLVTILKKRDN